ncbi:hypothetical protein [Devosia sp. CAU 1758]
MGLLANLASLFGLEVENLADRVKSTALVYGLIGLFSLVAVAFLVAAGFMTLAERVGPIQAALILAGVFLALALVVYLAALVHRNSRRRHLAERRRSHETSAVISTAAITALPLLARSPGLLKLGLPVAALAAYALLRGHKDD